MFTAQHTPTIPETIHSFAEAAEGLADLNLVRVVDATVDALLASAKFYRNHAVLGRSIIAQINDAPVVAGTYLDPDYKLTAGLAELAERHADTLSAMTIKKGAIDEDSRLSGSHCDMLHTAYDDALLFLATLIEVTKDMRAAVISYDLKAEPRGGASYASATEMHTALLRQ